MPYVTDGKIGIDLTATSATSQFTLGTKVQGDSARNWYYVKNGGGSDIAATTVVKVFSNFNTLTNANGNFTTSTVGIPANQYGWVFKTANDTQ
jgi:hypothetical protein